MTATTRALPIVRPALDNPYLAEFLSAYPPPRLPALARGEVFGVSHETAAMLEAAERQRERKARGLWDREELVARYAWGIPNDAAIDALAALGPIVELGAGTGYWAWLLRQRGVDVAAYDADPPDGNHVTWYHGRNRTWSPVKLGTPALLARHHAGRALLLCWPPHLDGMALECLEAYRGDTVAYVGEWKGHTADDAFHVALEDNWRREAEVAIPRWPLVHDRLYIYRR